MSDPTRDESPETEATETIDVDGPEPAESAEAADAADAEVASDVPGPAAPAAAPSATKPAGRPAPRSVRRSRLLLAVVAGAVVVGCAALGVVLNKPDDNGGSQPSNLPKGVSVLGGPITFPSDKTKDVVDVWQDFQCPACQSFETSDSGKALAKDAADGAITVNYHIVSFLDGGEVSSSHRAANAAYCASDQGRFLQFQAWAYEHQPEERTGGFTNTDLIAYGPQIGITDQVAYTSCIETSKYMQQVTASTDKMVDAKVQGTPTIFFNNEKVYPR